MIALAIVLACVAVVVGGYLYERRRLARMTPEEQAQDLLDQQTW